LFSGPKYFQFWEYFFASFGAENFVWNPTTDWSRIGDIRTLFRKKKHKIYLFSKISI